MNYQTKRSKKAWIMPAIIAVAILVLIYFAFSGGEEAPQDGAPGASGAPGAAGGQPPATKVQVMEVKEETLAMSEKIPGRVLAYRIAEIRPQVSGIIASRMFTEGSYVEKGQQLFQIEPDRYEADLKMAEASVQNARAELARVQALASRYQKLIKANAVSEQEYDDAQAGLLQAKASLASAEATRDTARINVEYTKVLAPISGFIGPTDVTEGALVQQQQAEAMATIRQLDPVYVDLSQPGSDSRELKDQIIANRGEGETRYPVSLYKRDDQSLYDHEGYIDATEQAVDVETGSIRLRAVFPNPEVTLLPGMFVQASIGKIGESKAITIPQRAATIAPSGEKFVWVMGEDNKAQKRSITTGQSVDQQWVVTEGLKPGEKVIIRGTMNLQDGAPVEVMKDDEKKDSPKASDADDAEKGSE